MFGHDTSAPLCMWLQVSSLCAASLFRITGLEFESNSWHPASNAIISVDDVLYTWQSYFSDNESTTWLWLVTRASRESIHVVALASRSSAQASEADAQVLER
jgi:hypothetical protein